MYTDLYIAIHLLVVPISATEGITVLYVFVDIKIDLEHLLQTLKFNFQPVTKLVRSTHDAHKSK